MAAAAKEKSREECFQTAVESVLSNWTALRMMVSDSPDVGDDFIPWLAGATAQWFSENKDLEIDEVEGFYEDVVINEFNLSVEDGSLQEVGRSVWDLYDICMKKSMEEVMAKLQSLPKGSDLNLSNCKVEDRTEGAATKTEGGESNGVVMDTEESGEVNGGGSKGGRPKPTTDEDGWTTVPSRKNKK